MQRNRGQLLEILSGMKEGVVAIDRDERIVHMNEVARRFLGIEPVVIHGRPLWEVTRVSKVNQILSRVMKERTGVTAEIRRAEPSSDQVFQISASPPAGAHLEV